LFVRSVFSTGLLGMNSAMEISSTSFFGIPKRDVTERIDATGFLQKFSKEKK